MRRPMGPLLDSKLFRTAVFLGAAFVLATLWAGGALVKLAQEESAPAPVAVAHAAGDVDFTPTGSIGKPVIINPCAMEPKR